MQNYGNNYYSQSAFYQPQPQRQVFEQPSYNNTAQYQYSQITATPAKTDDASFYLQSFENYFEQQGFIFLLKLT